MLVIVLVFVQQPNQTRIANLPLQPSQNSVPLPKCKGLAMIGPAECPFMAVILYFTIATCQYRKTFIPHPHDYLKHSRQSSRISSKASKGINTYYNAYSYVFMLHNIQYINICTTIECPFPNDHDYHKRGIFTWFLICVAGECTIRS